MLPLTQISQTGKTNKINIKYLENNTSLNFNAINDTKLILAAVRALIGEIRPNMRRVYVGYQKEKNMILLYFFYDTSPTQEEIDDDIEGVIITEMSVFFTEDVAWASRSYVLPYPQRIVDPSGLLVYSRYESTPK